MPADVNCLTATQSTSFIRAQNAELFTRGALPQPLQQLELRLLCLARDRHGGFPCKWLALPACARWLFHPTRAALDRVNPRIRMTTGATFQNNVLSLQRRGWVESVHSMSVEGGEVGFGRSDPDQTAVTSRKQLRSAHPELKEILVVARWAIDVVHVPCSGSDRMVDTQLHALS